MRSSICLGIAAVGLALTSSGAMAARIRIGPATVQALVSQQLFNRSGRWYLQDDGGVCYAYLDSPHTRLMGGRIYLDAHLSSRLGQRIGDYCAGVSVNSNVTLSGKPRGRGSKLMLEDARIEHGEDDAAGGAIDLIQQLAPQALPRALTIDLASLVRAQPTNVAGYTVTVDQFSVGEVQTLNDAIIVTFDFSLSSP